MYQTETKSSLYASKLIQQTNYSALSSLPKTYIRQVQAEGEIFMAAPQKCAKIWKEFRRNDFTQVQIPYKTALQVFDACKEDFQMMLKISSGKDFFDLFDQDNDGYLNEDEQILVFSIIKEKMQQVANLLLQIQQYVPFKQLMKAIRTLEQNICEYQDILRQKIYKSEVSTYKEIGFEKLDDFYEKYYNYFQQFENQKKIRIQMQIQKQSEEMGQLEDKLSKNTEFLKVKPKRKLKDLQTQEKLVSLDERVEEAMDFRRELKNMEKAEQERVASEQEKRIESQKDELQRKHQKQMEQLKAKLIEQEHKLIIQLKKEYNVLLKQIGLHSNEIDRIQSSATQNAIRKGEKEGELKRMKERARIQNFIIGETKRTMTPKPQQLNTSTYEDTVSSSPRSPAVLSKYDRAAHEIKVLIHKQNYTSFYIKKKYGADLPVNYKPEPYKLQGDNHDRIEKILSVKKKNPHDVLPSLTELYDENLKEQDKGSTQKSEQELVQERLKKKQFILEKLEESTH
ncbi:unnamed protein product [Paramecium primaurelia]|uniref:EF-hand domain-containing protein n=2 Tax=Paramecium TaxID=5884 RepID=A0A8S1VAW8_9CILI|nr:unnamed protein product [Paramecium primaurelia]CAD8173695.1 unnamed protein product [Paramecium pentaurelia]